MLSACPIIDLVIKNFCSVFNEFGKKNIIINIIMKEESVDLFQKHVCPWRSSTVEERRRQGMKIFVEGNICVYRFDCCICDAKNGHIFVFFQFLSCLFSTKLLKLIY